MRYVLSVVLLTICALFAGVCHGPHGLAATSPAAAAPAHHVCPGPAHGEHAGSAHGAALAAQPADRERPEGAGGGRGGERGADDLAPPAPVPGAMAMSRDGPPCPAFGQRLLVAIGVDRN
ncbi:hypothetical protein [Streptomyces aureocirculatus]|uniref:hypothetical protein n=1 Tax=Streptomyces aureocirculatus TaxID=67275 RepID=UPI00068AA83B|nr:hypothetical protein [Streptomyces aureocirculatus]